MKVSAFIALISVILAPCLTGQTQAGSGTQVPYEIRISPAVAEKLLVHKADLACLHGGMPARIIATVVVAIEIDRNGNVLHPTVISGPAMLRKPVLDVVRKYKYKPYLLNNKPVVVDTSVSVTIDSYRDCQIQ